MVIFENILLDRGGGGQISTPIYRDTEPGVSCAKIGVQTGGVLRDFFHFKLWGKRVSYKNGNVSFAYTHFLGYKKEDYKIVIDKAQAVVVRQIYQWFLRDGLTYNAIAARLIDAGVKTPGGKDKWMANNILSILTNEKYKGDAIL